MNALALIIGNADYTDPNNNLTNALNDAISISVKLRDLGFIIRLVKNCDLNRFEESVNEFTKELQNYDVGLFYFAGHGLQIKGLNYLTAANTQFFEESSVVNTSYPLDSVLQLMNKANHGERSVNILILDACRNNPFRHAFRGLHTMGLAPVRAPKGTIIAYSTSPGETAMDGGSGENSIYTGAFLQHIDVPAIPIEDFFKRVRTTVYTMTNGAQTSWEHTSLIGDFCFNDKLLNHAIGLPYGAMFIADEAFESDGSHLQTLISKMRIYDYYTQGPALDSFKHLSKSDFSPEGLFLMGRNILQSAVGGEYKAEKVMNNLTYWLPYWQTAQENHVLFGMLYEMYFNSKGRMRKAGFKNKYIEQLYDLETNSEYQAAFLMIARQLEPFPDNILYRPFELPVAIDVILEKRNIKNFKDEEDVDFKLVSIKHKGLEMFHPTPSIPTRFYHQTESKYPGFRERVSKTLMVPLNKLTMICNIFVQQITYIVFPDDLMLSKRPFHEETVL